MKKTEGIIIKKTPRREADAIFTLYTKELGLASFQAKGVRKQTAKLKAGLDVFNWTDIYFVQAKFLPIVTDARIKNDLCFLKKDLGRLKLAQAAAAAVSKIVEPGVADKRMWREISGLFSFLNNSDSPAETLEQETYLFCYRALVANGLMPRVDDKTDPFDFKNRVRDFFGYHFGTDLEELI